MVLLIAASFMQDLSQAIFVNLAEDERDVRTFHTGTSKQAMGLGNLNKKGPQYWNTHVRRMVKQPAALKRALDDLIQKYSGSAGLDSGGRPLLTEATEQVLGATKELIDSGSFCGELQTPLVVIESIGHLQHVYQWWWHSCLNVLNETL